MISLIDSFRGSSAASIVIEFSLSLRAFGSAWEFVCCNLCRLGDQLHNYFDIVNDCRDYFPFDCLVRGL